MTSEDVGVSPGSPSTFTAAYDADGKQTTHTYPSGLVATTGYDNTGNPTGLSYTQAGSTWLAFTAARGADGRIAAQTSPASAQVFGYDPDGRLTTVADTVNGTGGSTACTTRSYGFSANSDRTSLTSYPAGTGGACSTSTTASTTTSSFDTADRITTTGYSYDTLGRTSTLPAADAHGIGTYSTDTGAATIGYYSNDMVASET